MSENVYFYKGKEANLPKSGIVVGGLYHCTDTKNTYIGISATKMELWANGAIKRHTVTKADGTQTIAGAGTETTTASGALSFAEGNLTNALGKGSHAEGGSTYAEKDYSHAEGGNTKAQGVYSHTEGYQTITTGEASHAEGRQATAAGAYSHAEGYKTKATGEGSHAEGNGSEASGTYSHAEGSGLALGVYSHAEGEKTIAKNKNSHTEGSNTLTTGDNAHAEGQYTGACGLNSHTEGANSFAFGEQSHAEGGRVGTILTNAKLTSNAKDDTIYTVTGISADTILATGYIVQTQNDRSTAYIIEIIGNQIKLHQSIGKDLNATPVYIYTNYNLAAGTSSHAEGDQTQALGVRSHTEGYLTIANGDNSHAEGNATQAIGTNAHAEGSNTYAEGLCAHAEGNNTHATAANTHAEGTNTHATATNAHAEGSGTLATGANAHAEGANAKATGNNAHAEGDGYSWRAIILNGAANTTSYTYRADPKNEALLDINTILYKEQNSESLTVTITDINRDEKILTVNKTLSPVELNNYHAYTQGYPNEASGVGAHSEGCGSLAKGDGSHAEGGLTIAKGDWSHAEGAKTQALGINAHAEGWRTLAIANESHAEGSKTTASGIAGAHAEGKSTEAFGGASHAEGSSSKAVGNSSHAEGYNTTASGYASHAEGYGQQKTQLQLRISCIAGSNICTYSGTSLQAHVGDFLQYNNITRRITQIDTTTNTITLNKAFSATETIENKVIMLIIVHNMGACGNYSHAEGYVTTAKGIGSHAEGQNTIAEGNYSHTEGYATRATKSYQHVQGKYNKTVDDAAFIVGNGSSTARSNAHVLKWNGDAYYAGDVYAGSAIPGSTDAKKLATENQVKAVNNKIGSSADTASANTVYGNIAALKGTATDDKLTALTLHGLDNRTKFMLGTNNPSNNHTIQNALNEARQADADAENAYKLADAALPLSGNKKMTGSLQTSGIILDPNIDYGPKTPSINNGTGQLFFQEDDSTPIKVIDLSQYCDSNLITVQFARVIMANNYPILLQMLFTPKQDIAPWTHIVPQTAGLIVNASTQSIYDTSNQYVLQVRSTFIQTASTHYANTAYAYNFPLY